MSRGRRGKAAAPPSPNLGNIFLGQEEKFGLSQFLKKFACVCVCVLLLIEEIFSLLN